MDSATPDIVVTKLLVPATRSAVDRPHLIEELNRGEPARLTLVCAPTGWGKSSILAAWAGQAPAATAWVALDARDDDPVRFWRHVITALERALPELDRGASKRLGAPGVVIRDEVLPLLTNGLAAADRPVALAIDDLQAVRNSDVLEGLSQLIERKPANLRVLVASQTEPPLRLGRLRAHGELVEIRAQQLAFRQDEAASLLNSGLGLDLDAEEVALVVERTEGWPAGIQLAALSLPKNGARETTIAADLPIDQRHLAQYLWDEVVARQRPGIRDFLLETSILERLHRSLCDTVRGARDSQAVLEEVAAANLFLIALDSGGTWFRYHSLFREMLEHLLAQKRPPAEIAELHRRAGRWYAERGNVSDAVEHALAAGDVEDVAALIRERWMALYNIGRGATVSGWLDRLPRATILADPDLCLVRAGLAMLLGRHAEVPQWLSAAAASDITGPVPGFGSSVASSVALTEMRHRLALGDAPGALEAARRAEALEAGDDEAARAFAEFAVGESLFWNGETEEARRRLESAIPVAYAAGWLARAYVAQAIYSMVLPDPATAEREARRALAAAAEGRLLDNLYTALVHIAVGVALRDRGALIGAGDQLERAVVLARRGRQPLFHALALLELACLHRRQGDPDAAANAVSAARREADLDAVPALAARVAKLNALPGGVVSDGSGRPLSRGELRVLKLFPTDLTYREMASSLYLSLSTVRTHARHIRSKLGASTRAEAVARAREQGYL